LPVSLSQYTATVIQNILWVYFSQLLEVTVTVAFIMSGKGNVHFNKEHKNKTKRTQCLYQRKWRWWILVTGRNSLQRQSYLRELRPLPLRVTGPPGPGGSTCQGPRPQGYEGARRESLAVVKVTRLGETTLDKSWSSRLGVCREASSLTQEKYLIKSSTRKRRMDDFRTTKAC
jgi:hypothetical protein